MTPQILVAEYEQDIRELYKDALALLVPDAELILAENGEQAVSKLEELAKNGSPPDLVITDGVMGGQTDGLGVIRAAQSACSNSRIIIITYLEYVGKNALTSGASVYLKKPFSMVDFDKAVKEQLSYAT